MNYKTLAAVILLAFIAYSCQDEDDGPVVLQPLEIIKVDDLLDLVPNELKKTEGVAVYVDANGNEKRLKTY